MQGSTPATSGGLFLRVGRPLRVGLAPPSPLWGGVEGGGIGEHRTLASVAEINAGTGSKTLVGSPGVACAGPSFSSPNANRPYYVDFLCHGSKLVIEVDGDTHFVGNGPAYDGRRGHRIAADGFRVIRFSNHEVVTNLDGVLEAISLALANHHPDFLPPQYRRKAGHFRVLHDRKPRFYWTRAVSVSHES